MFIFHVKNGEAKDDITIRQNYVMKYNEYYRKLGQILKELQVRVLIMCVRSRCVKNSGSPCCETFNGCFHHF